MRLNFKNDLIYRMNKITHDGWERSRHLSKICCSLYGISQNVMLDWCSKKYCELCRCVFDFVDLKLNIAGNI